jgi:hypothetical protein
MDTAPQPDSVAGALEKNHPGDDQCRDYRLGALFRVLTRRPARRDDLYRHV